MSSKFYREAALLLRRNKLVNSLSVFTFLLFVNCNRKTSNSYPVINLLSLLFQVIELQKTDTQFPFSFFGIIIIYLYHYYVPFFPFYINSTSCSAATILPVVKRQHQLLVTLLLCNACAMEVKIYLSVGITKISDSFNDPFFEDAIAFP